MRTLTVASRFCGPPDTANGGYLAGLFAQYASQPQRIRLQRPVPLETVLSVEATADGDLQLCQGEQVLALAQPAELELQVPRPPDYVQALDASRHFTGFAHHVCPGCFVCGTQRARGDGLRIFAGPLDARAGEADGVSAGVAAPWVPDASVAGDAGKVRPEFMAAALDCPGYYAARDDGVLMLLAQFTAHVDRCVHVDEPCVVMGWRIGLDGRKYDVGTALFDEDGECCARARALWIEPRA